MDREKALWFAVVAQAVTDIQDFPIGSTEYTQASCFLLDSGPWGLRREEIAEYLDLHGDDLKRIGLRVINAKRLSAGLAPLTGKESRFVSAKPKLAPEPEMVPEAAPEMVFVRAGVVRRLAPEAVPGIYTWRRASPARDQPREPLRNPFHPGYRRAM